MTNFHPPGVSLVQLCANPALPSMTAAVYSNGAAALFMVDAATGKVDCCTLPPAANINCFSWSPKGKQIVAGKKKQHKGFVTLDSPH